MLCCCVFFFQAEDGIRDLVRSRGLGDVYKRQDRDSGVRAGQISYRKAGLELAFTPVESAVKDGKILARLPSDDMGKGAYEPVSYTHLTLPTSDLV